jgi:hypothetical protein
MGDKIYSIGDKVVIVKAGDGCEIGEHNKTGGPGVGAICEISDISQSGLPCGTFLVGNPAYGSWWTTSEHFIPYVEGMDVVQVMNGEPESKSESEPAVGPDYPTGGTVKSLHPGSESLYKLGHVRVDGMSIRFQGKIGHMGAGWEANALGASDGLREYIGSLPHTCASVAGTGTKYVPCRFRPASEPSTLRVQIAGPANNRPWGVEFEVMTNAPMHKAAPASMVTVPEPVVVTMPEPASPGAPGSEGVKPEGVAFHSTLELAYLAKFGTATPQDNPTVACKLCGHPWNDHYSEVCPVKVEEPAA